nr:MAG TPA: hypothetical protein [Caudoviricetes sp.]
MPRNSVWRCWFRGLFSLRIKGICFLCFFDSCY